MTKWSLVQESKVSLTWKSINVTYHTKWNKGEIICSSHDTQKNASYKYHYTFIIKTLSKLEIDENIFTMIKNIYEKTYT